VKTFAVLLILLPLASYSQPVNLVSNPSFEVTFGCPNGNSVLDSVANWMNVANHLGSPDYFDNCRIGVYSVPDNYMGSENAATGNSYMGMLLWSEDPLFKLREYLVMPLATPLSAGVLYSISFKYSLAEGSNYSTSSFGFYFSNQPLVGDSTNEVLNVVPQVSVSAQMDNQTGWTTMVMEYTAVGGEQYFTCGNFLNDSATVVSLVTNINTWVASYIYVDDFSLSESNGPAGIIHGPKPDLQLQVYPNPAVDQVTVVLPGQTDESKLRLFNVAGLEVWTGSLSPDIPTQIQLGNLAAGLYYLEAGEYVSLIMKR
jgi:hypothetical protein